MSTNKNLPGTNGDPWWRAWWRRFRKDFSSAEPEKQVAQVALDWFAKAERFGPYDPGRWSWFDAKGQALLLLGRDDEAIRSLRTAIEVNPTYVSAYAVLAAAYALKGFDEEAHVALAHYRRSNPDMTVSTFRSLSPVPLTLTSPAYLKQRERLKEGLRKAGMPE